MKIEQIYTGCLAEAAYYIESQGEAAIIDPLRETSPYVQKAKENRSRIKYIFETHFHADFVSGHLDLAHKTGAMIIYGPGAECEFDIYQAHDGEEFQLGNVTIRVLHTPGHTPESSTYLLINEEGREHAIFTGDTLFIGDVGRPDLAISSDLTQEDLAGMLYDSLRDKIMPLKDEVLVYPAHGAGSSCGKNMSDQTYDTLGHQKKTNYALRDITKQQFIEEVTEGILPAPQYFAKNAMLNKNGYEAIDTVIGRGMNPMNADEFEKQVDQGILVLDTRQPQDYCQGHVPGSVYIGLEGSFAVWVGTLITDLKQTILLVTPEGREEETVMRLARVGYDNTGGYLEGGFNTWQIAGKKIDTITSLSPAAVEKLAQEKQLNWLDVRRPGEYEVEHVQGSINYTLDFINQHLNDLDRSRSYVLHCASGYRSVIAASILKRHGYQHLTDVDGGYEAIRKTGIKRTSSVSVAAN